MAKQPSPVPKRIHGALSYQLKNKHTELFVTPEGGQIAPVHFQLGEGRSVQPYSLPPWQPQEYPDLPPVLRLLRGDFFCFPFGESEGIDLPHGETANRDWSLTSAETGILRLSMQLSKPASRIQKTVRLAPDAPVFYQEHRIEGVEGRYNYGHHPILQIPEGHVAAIRTSNFCYGQTYREPVEEVGNEQSLTAGEAFSSLDEVPTRDGGGSRIDQFPLRPETEEIVMISRFDEGPLAWNLVEFPDCFWFSIRPVQAFPSTLFWMSNGGRISAPWNGRHTGRIGIEDVCSHFHDGCHVSAEERLKKENIPTSRRFRPDEIVILRHAQGVIARTDQSSLSQLQTVALEDDHLELRFETGGALAIPVQLDWLAASD